jgi:hypothetical protein
MITPEEQIPYLQKNKTVNKLKMRDAPSAKHHGRRIAEDLD